MIVSKYLNCSTLQRTYYLSMCCDFVLYVGLNQVSRSENRFQGVRETRWERNYKFIFTNP
jgi:hypothetical protein